MKQTAVEWLENQLLSPEFRLDADYYEFIYGLCQQAKAIEKEQIIQTWYDCKMSVIEKNPTTADQYYNQTFKSE